MGKNKIGGQAVVDGVMIRGKKGIATSIRLPNGRINVKLNKVKEVKEKNIFLKIPVIRGIILLYNTLIFGMKELNANTNNSNENEISKLEKYLSNKLGKSIDDIFLVLSILFSLIVFIGIFIVMPVLITEIISKLGIQKFLLNFIEGIISVGIVITYIYLISKNKETEKLFEYHGAEHKVINCYEKNQELTIENVKKSSRFHPRCGTNFSFIIVIVNVFLLSFINWGSLASSIMIRLVCLPLVIGISYEILKWISNSDTKIAKIMLYPGLKLQMLTTREPNNMQIEVAIMALKKAEGINETEKTIEELLTISKNILKSVEIDTYILDSNLLLGKVLNKDKLYFIMNKDEKVSIDKEKEFMELLEKRKRKMPMQYILKNCEFMGLEFYVEEGVLVPRGDTEILVEEVLKEIGEEEKLSICDLCCGSGSIGVSLAHYRKNILVDLVDIEKVPEKVTKININNLNVQDRCNFIKSDLLTNITSQEKRYDVLVSNPPYIKGEVINTLMEDVKNYEPHIALDGGIDGLDFYRKIITDSKKVLKEKGILAFEIGFDQGKDVKTLMDNNGYKDIRVVKDLAGLDRVVIGYITDNF